jgi:hypothetical protein
MQKYSVLIFFLCLPIVAALGHDIYITYHDENYNKAMMFSDIGYLWTHYSKDTYDWARENVDKGTWKKFIGPFLEQRTLLIASLPLIITFAVIAVLKLFRLTPSQKQVRVAKGHKKGNFGFEGTDKGKSRMKYKRK